MQHVFLCTTVIITFKHTTNIFFQICILNLKIKSLCVKFLCQTTTTAGTNEIKN